MSRRWRSYQYSPFLRELVENRLGKVFYEDQWANYFKYPLFRTLSAYTGHGMSLFGLARVTLQEPREVWEQLQRERSLEVGNCWDTKLMVIYRPWSMNVGNLSIAYYASRAHDYDGFAARYHVPSFEEMLKKYPLKKCRLCFNPHKRWTHKFSPQERDKLKFAYTLGLSEKEAQPYLLP